MNNNIIKTFYHLLAIAIVLVLLIISSRYAKDLYNKKLFEDVDSRFVKQLIKDELPIEPLVPEIKGKEIETKYGGPYCINIHVVENASETQKKSQTTIRSTFKEYDRVFVSIKRVGEHHFETKVNGVLKEQWQSHGSEISLPDETFLFDNEITGTEDDPLTFYLDQDIGWCWIRGKGEYLKNGKKVQIPPQKTIVDPAYNLFAKLRSKEWKDRAEGAWILGQLKDRRAKKDLRELLDDSVWYVRRFAIQALAQIKDHEDIARILPLLKDDNREIRRTTARALREYVLPDENTNNQPTMEKNEILSEKKREEIIKNLEEALNDDDRWVVGEVAQTLESYEPQAAISLLRKKVGNAKKEKNHIALVTLAQLKDPWVKHKAMKTLDSPKIYVAYASIESLFLLDCSDCRKIILELAKNDERKGVRSIALHWVRGLSEEDHQQLLIDKLIDSNADIREEAARMLSYMGWLPNTPEEKTAYHFSAKHWKKLRELKNIDAEFLCLGLKDKEKDVRLETARLISKVKSESNLSCLKSRLTKAEGEKENDVKVELILAIANIKSDKSLSLVKPFLKNEDNEIKSAAIKGLATLRDKSYIPTFVNFLDDPSSKVRKSAADSLYIMDWQPPDDNQRFKMQFGAKQWLSLNIEDKKVLSFLLDKGVNDQDDNIRKNVYRLLGTVKKERALNALLKALKDSSLQAVDNATNALGNLGEFAVPALKKSLKKKKYKTNYVLRALGLTKSKKIYKTVSPYLTHSDWDIRLLAYNALHDSGLEPDNPQEAAQYLLAGREWIELVNLGKPGWKHLEKELKSSDDSNKKLILHGLRVVKTQRTVDILIKYLKNKDSDLKTKAKESLIFLGNMTTLSLIKAFKTKSKNLRKTIIEIFGETRDKSSLELLLKTMGNDKNNEIRKACAKAVSIIGDKRAVPELVKALEDSNSGVCKAAKNALIKLKWRPTSLAEKKIFKKIKL